MISVFGDLILDEYVQVIEKENQEVSKGKKLIYYYDNKNLKKIIKYGGAGNFFKYLNTNKKIFYSLAFPNEIKKNFKDKKLLKKTKILDFIKSDFVPIKTRYLDNQNKILIRVDCEYKNKAITNKDIKKIKNIHIKNSEIVCLIDYDKYYFKKLKEKHIIDLLKKFININKIKTLAIMPKPENYKKFVKVSEELNVYTIIFMNKYEYNALNRKIYNNDNITHIITYNEEGVLLLNQNSERFIVNDYPLYDINNTSGAGDVFAATTISNFYKGMNLIDSIKNSFKLTTDYLIKINKGEE